MATYDLDVAFSSDTSANDTSLPIAMAYGFTDNTGGTFVGRGQTKSSMQPGSTVGFWVYDTAPNPVNSLTSVQISVVNKSQSPNAPKSPFSDAVWNNVSSITAPTQVPLSSRNSPARSTGCNVTGVSWGIGPFTVANLSGQQRFEITVTVVTPNGQSQKTFTVDPEVVVDSGNK